MNNVCVYDFETDGKNPTECEPVQLAACMINADTLKVIPNSIFCSHMRPPDIKEEGYFDEHLDTIMWHASMLNPGFAEFSTEDRQQAIQKVFDTWYNAPEQKDVFQYFQDYLKKYHKFNKRKTMFSAPIRAGANILNFDDIIIHRLCDRANCLNKEGRQKIFHPRDFVDLTNIAMLFFCKLDEPSNYSMEALRDFLGLEQEGAHEARKDVEDTAKMIIRFMRLIRNTSKKVKFKDSMIGA